MANLLALVALARANRDRHARLADGTTQTALRLWDEYRPVSDDDLARWQAATLPIVEGAQRAAVAQQIGYLSAYSTAAGVPVRVPRVDVDALLGGLRNGTSLAESYARPVLRVRTALSGGQDILTALRAGRVDLRQRVDTDIMLAGRAGGHEAMQQFPHIVGYRRQPNPNACEYCLLASTQRYHVRDLQPLHANCRCSPTGIPIIGEQDPGLIIDRELHAQLKNAGVVEQETVRRQIATAKKTGRDERLPALRARQAELKQQIDMDPVLRYRREVAVHEHGELGPMLGAADHEFATL